MQLNGGGKVIKRWWVEITKKFSNTEIDEYIIMANHFHGILLFVDNPVGATLCGCPLPPNGHPHRGAPTLGDVIDWFKTMTTNEYIKGVKSNVFQPFISKLWQRNYDEHIIRNDDELNRIRQYIIENPIQWEMDRENPDAKKKEPNEPWQV